MPISVEKKLIFVHVPKNAGTAITNSVESKFRDQGHHTAIYYKNQYAKEWETFLKFAVIRNPWDRVVSNYEYARMPVSYWHSADESRPYAAHFDYHTLKDVSFEECVNMLYKNRDSLRHQGWGTQKYWVCDTEGNLLIDKFFLHDKLDDDLDFNRLIPDLEKVNQSNRKSSNYKDYYTQDLIDKVGEIYKEDIKLFNLTY